MPTLKSLCEGLKAGEVRALAKAISLAENDPGAGDLLTTELGIPAARAIVLGITGATGVGKSTLIKTLIEEVLNGGRRVGVLAVDPSSPLSGGALLGDRFRMVLPEVSPDRLFIRSLSSRGHEGGTSRGLGVGVQLLCHAGYDVVLVETTGVGQCEFDVVRVVDLVCLLLAEGFGDDLQAMKSGLMEIADVLVINKCRRPGTEHLRRDLESHVAHSSRFAQFQLLPPPVLLTDGLSGEGVAELWQRLVALHSDPAVRAASSRKRQLLSGYAAVAAVIDRLKDHLFNRLHGLPLNGASQGCIGTQVGEWLLEACHEVERWKLKGGKGNQGMFEESRAKENCSS